MKVSSENIQFIRREFLTAFRYFIVGILATFTHILIVLFLINQTTMPTLLANTISFLIAFCVSFVGHYFWTFSTSQHWVKAVQKFFIIAFGGFFLNTVVLASLLQFDQISRSVAAIVAVAVVPLATFLASRFWGFKN